MTPELNTTDTLKAFTERIVFILILAALLIGAAKGCVAIRKRVILHRNQQQPGGLIHQLQGPQR